VNQGRRAQYAAELLPGELLGGELARLVIHRGSSFPAAVGSPRSITERMPVTSFMMNRAPRRPFAPRAWPTLETSWLGLDPGQADRRANIMGPG
jgi:hypothetical protein